MNKSLIYLMGQFITTLERQFLDVLNEVPNHDCQWHLSEQSVNRSTLVGNDESNYNARHRLGIGVHILQPPGLRDTQPHTRGAFHHCKHSPHTIPETTFSCHNNTQSRSQTYHITWNKEHAYQLTPFRATSVSHDHQISIKGNLFGQTALLITISVVNIKTTIPITLT